MIVVYNLFLGLDWLSNSGRAGALRALPLPRYGLGAARGALFETAPSAGVREGVASSLPILVAMQALAMFLMSHSPAAAHYQYLVALLIMYANVIHACPTKARSRSRP